MKFRTLLIFFLVGSLELQAQSEVALRERAVPEKAGWKHIEPGYSTQRISVKFKDGTDFRAVAGELRATTANSDPVLRGLLKRLGKRWQRAYSATDDSLEALRQRGQSASGKALPDLRLQFEVTLPPGVDALETVNALMALDCVEYAAPVPTSILLPQTPPPERVVWQDYLQASPAGIDADYLWSAFGTRGSGVRVVDIEFDFNSSHADLPAITRIPGGFQYTAAGNDHGTAVFGIMSMKPNNGFGGNGIAPDAQYYFSNSFKTSTTADIADAIVRSFSYLNPGDIILIEQQIAGPGGNATTQEGYVSPEWYKPYYDAVKTAVASGCVVIIPAGNGRRNLDDPIEFQHFLAFKMYSTIYIFYFVLIFYRKNILC